MGNMRAYGITLSGPMVSTLLRGESPDITAHKIVKFKYYHSYTSNDNCGLACVNGEYWLTDHNGFTITHKLKPRYKAGSIVYVREIWKKYEKAVGEGEQFHVEEFLAYKADIDNPKVQKTCEWYDGHWRPPQQMPKNAVRLFLQVAKTPRITKLHDVDYVGLITSGIDTDISTSEWNLWSHCRHMNRYQIANEIYKKRFKALWDSEYGKKNGGIHSWDANPYVESVKLELAEASAG